MNVIGLGSATDVTVPLGDFCDLKGVWMTLTTMQTAEIPAIANGSLFLRYASEELRYSITEKQRKPFQYQWLVLCKNLGNATVEIWSIYRAARISLS